MSAIEYLIRVRREGDEFTASLRQLAGAAHPDVRAVLGPVAHGHGANEAAAMVSAIANARVGQVAVREVGRVE